MFLKVKRRNFWKASNYWSNQYLESGAGLCESLYCPKKRQFELHVVDHSNEVCVRKKAEKEHESFVFSPSQEVIRIKREFRYCAGCINACACCSTCQEEAVIESPPGTVVGYVSQT